ncbi:MAG: hypothetical protein ACRCZQ_05600 [Bacteroidales bacterium]
MKIENDIHKFLIRNSIISYSSAIIAIVAIVICFMTISKQTEESRKYLYMVKDSGEVVPMEWVNRRDNLDIEMKHHLQMMVENMYSINQFNYEEKVINKGFWLGDFEPLHNNRKSKGYYNIFIHSNIEQAAILLPQNIELERITNTKSKFRIIIDMKRNYGNTERSFVVFAVGEIEEKTRNFPYNPHGLWITKYFEEKIITDEE